MTEVMRGLASAGHGDLQPHHSAALRPLWDHPEGMRAVDLASEARITKQSMASIVEQLEERGYVERVDDPHDKRAKLVRLTKHGRNAGRIMRALVRRVETDWAKRIGPARLALVREALRDLVSSFEADDGA